MYEMIEKEKQAQNKMKENIEKLDENIKKSVNN
jgi:septation ring formation regulator EzrA